MANPSPLRVVNIDEMREQQAKFEKKSAELEDSGQKIFARIIKKSKYYGQGRAGELFPVVITFGEYTVVGLGNQYRLLDVDLFVEFEGGDKLPTQITFNEKK